MGVTESDGWNANCLIAGSGTDQPLSISGRASSSSSKSSAQLIGLAGEVVALDGVAIGVVGGEINAVVEAGVTRGRMSSSTSFIGNGIAAFTAAPCGKSP